MAESSPATPPPPPLLAGRSDGPDLFEVLKLAVRTRKSGILTLSAREARAEIWIQDGAIVAAFFNDLAGAPALTRAILCGRGAYALEVHEGRYPRNISQSTTHILEAIDKILAECGDRLWLQEPGAESEEHAAHPQAAPASDALEPSEGNEESHQDDTLVLASFNPPETGRVFGKCLLEEEIGRGSSAIVYRARHRTLDLPVVVKVLMQDTPDQREHHELSRNEAQLLARLNHPHILRVYDFHDTGHHPHLVMEYVDGSSLAGLIERQGAVPADDCLPIFCQVAEAMTYAHAQCGMVHCDIKPSNILLTRALEAKVADFGLAKVTRMTPKQLEARERIKDRVAGTPAYIAPEQVEGGWDSATHRSDIYALGATFYHALTGHLPFVADDPIEMMAKRLRLDPVPPHLVRPGIDRGVSDLVMTMLVRDPVHRVHTWMDLLGALYHLIEVRDQERVAAGEEKIIRRRTSFWSQVPALMRRPQGPETPGATQVG